MNAITQSFKLDDDRILRASDIQSIYDNGLTAWALEQISIWHDKPLDWESQPLLVRQMIINDAIEPLGMEFSYAVPFRAMGRIITFALLPTTPKPIEIVRRTEVRRVNIQTAPRPRVDEYVDPPVPFPLLGCVAPGILAMHCRAVSEFLRTADQTAFNKRLWEIATRFIGQKITKTEAFYYLLFMRAVGCRSWQMVREFTGLLTLEWVINQAVNLAPGQTQELAYAHLVAGRPLNLPVSIDRVEIR